MYVDVGAGLLAIHLETQLVVIRSLHADIQKGDPSIFLDLMSEFDVLVMVI